MSTIETDPLKLAEYWRGVIGPTDDAIVAGRLARALIEAQRDASRYRWLKKADEAGLAAIAYRVKDACAFGTADEAIDAAMNAVIDRDQKRK